MKKAKSKKNPFVNVDWSGRLKVYSSSDYLPVRALAHRVKDGDKEGVSKAATIMAGLVKNIPDYKNGVLVPMPGRTGIALYICFGEPLTLISGLGIALILTAVVILNRK